MELLPAGQSKLILTLPLTADILFKKPQGAHFPYGWSVNHKQSLATIDD